MFRQSAAVVVVALAATFTWKTPSYASVIGMLLTNEHKIQITTHPVILTNVTSCVRRLDIGRDGKGGFGAYVTGPDGHKVYVNMAYRYAQVWTYTASRRTFVSIDFANVWGTDVATSLGIACKEDRAFFFVIDYPEARPNTPLPYWPGTP
jgi:hypothetical protein